MKNNSITRSRSFAAPLKLNFIVDRRARLFLKRARNRKNPVQPPHDSFLHYDKRTLGFRNVFNEKKLPIWSCSQNLVLAHVCAAEIC